MSKFHFGLAIFVVACAGASTANQPPATASASAVQPPPAASTVQTQESAQRTVAQQPSVVGGEICHGTIDEALQHQLAGRAAQVRFCYERLLQRDPQREGRIVVTVRLSGTGRIDRAAITLDNLGDPETSDCALTSFKEPLVGAITGGDCAIANVPLRFKTKKADPPTIQSAPAAQ